MLSSTACTLGRNSNGVATGGSTRAESAKWVRWKGSTRVHLAWKSIPLPMSVYTT